MTDFENEKSHLKETINKLKSRKNYLFNKLDGLTTRKSDPELVNTFIKIYNRELLDIENHSNSPYFAKIIYKDSSEPKEEELYIGKVGFLDCENNYIVTDWRAPIATLYYDSEVGNVSYIAPEGLKKGQLNLKRQILIEDGELQSISDSDLMTNDELLRPYLNKASDKRLKSIIATIQKEQNKIIRADRKDLIVQGVAGSGKTTVALHRISYLIYQMKKFDSSTDFLIIGPNKIFLKYISSVLPDLDTGEISQYTFEEITRAVIGENFKVYDKNRIFNCINEETYAYLNIKTSDLYKKLIDEFIQKTRDSFLPNEIQFKGFTIFNKGELEKSFEQFDNNDMQTNLTKLASHIAEKLLNPAYAGEIINKINRSAKERGKEISLKDTWDLQKIFEKGAQNFLKKQLVFNKISTIGVYAKFMEFLKTKGGFKELAEETSKNIKNKVFDFEDLAALIYIRQKLIPCKKFSNICHLIIDEAQDLGNFHYQALRSLFTDCVFDLYGDLNQSIYSYSSIKNWNDVSSLLFKDENQYFELRKSYRTTIEIMDAANLIGDLIPLVKGEPVIRHGEKVSAYECTCKEHEIFLAKFVKEELKKYNNVSVLCNNEEDCKIAKELLNKNKIEAEILTSDIDIKGVIITTIYQAKGLEFDSVIVFNASADAFDEKKEIDMKLLYVAMTRAMHDLKILSKGKITSALKTLVAKNDA